MKLTIPTKQLVAALATIKAIAKPSTTHVIIGNVCIVASKDGITLLGMDLEKQLSIKIACSVKQQGSTTVPCSKLHDSLAKARGADCVIESNGAHEMTIRVGSDRKLLKGLDPSEMPQQIKSEGGVVVNISAEKFNDALKKVVIHASSDPTRPIFNTVFAVSKSGKLVFQASDNKRGCMCNTDTDYEAEAALIIPKDSIAALSTLASSGEIEVTFSESGLSAKTKNCEFRTLLLEGRMPDFERAFSIQPNVKIVIGREDLISALEYAEIEIPADAKKANFECDGTRMVVVGANIPDKDGGFMNLNEGVRPVEKGSGSIAFKTNPQFLRETLKCLTGDQITLEMVDAKNPIIIQEPGIICMVMPML